MQLKYAFLIDKRKTESPEFNVPYLPIVIIMSRSAYGRLKCVLVDCDATWTEIAFLLINTQV